MDMGDMDMDIGDMDMGGFIYGICGICGIRGIYGKYTSDIRGIYGICMGDIIGRGYDMKMADVYVWDRDMWYMRNKYTYPASYHGQY